MAKQPLVIPARPENIDSPPPQYVTVTFFVGAQRYQIQLNMDRELLRPNRPPEVIPIDRKRLKLPKEPRYRKVGKPVVARD